MGPPEILKQNEFLTNAAGFLDVNRETLQHNKFKNIYGLGDCTSTPNSKTMAAIGIVLRNKEKNLILLFINFVFFYSCAK
jgi:NADPH-dependent 2,4-dienoyl-CoA reductase/sulfur reductase-like enzyme